MPSMFTGPEFSCEIRFRRGRRIYLKGLWREVYIDYRVGYSGRDTSWTPFGDPLPLIDNRSDRRFGVHLHDVFHFAMAESALWSPVVRDGIFGVEGQWKGPDVGMLMEESIVLNEWAPKPQRASLEWCHHQATGMGGADCTHAMLEEALETGRAEWRSAVRQFEQHGESQHAFGLRMLDDAHRYGSGALSGVGADGRNPDL